MRLFALLVLQFTVLAAQATCMFARDAKPQDWYEWASVLVAGDVAAVEQRGTIDLTDAVVGDYEMPRSKCRRSCGRRAASTDQRWASACWGRSMRTTMRFWSRLRLPMPIG